ncbi:MAG: hypothetical protein E6H76_13190 [Betaproteobacteria bacterium]|nr:MAG: hypothetical protein E6H76_13190 [Betaproteobacteria bacterium]
MVMGKFLALPDADEPARPTELTPEEVSLLMDGELDADRAERACHGLREVASVQTWICYHVIGDCLRGDGAPMWGISKRFAARLAAEPTVTTMPLPPSAIATAQRVDEVRAADLRRPVVNEYLLTHQEYSPTMAIQGVRPYLRAVTADPQDAAK